MHLRAAAIAIAALAVAFAAAGATPTSSALAASAGGAAGAKSAGQLPDDPVRIALDHVRKAAEDLGVRGADVADLVVASAYESPDNGVAHVNLTQRFEGLEVFGASATVNVAQDGEVLFVGDSLREILAPQTPSAPTLDARDAVEAAAKELDLNDPAELRVISGPTGRALKTVLSKGDVSSELIPARLGWHPAKGGLRLAWQLTIDATEESHLWNATVDADTGELLKADDWTDHDSAEELATTLARGSTKAPLPAALASPDPVDDGSSYRVFALPKESPNDGGRTFVSNPADALASPFGWHDTNGAAGPELTTTQGNNVHTYTDRDATNVPDPTSNPDGGAGLDFDFPLDLGEHAYNYSAGAVTNLFYWNNVLHDVMYRYGFDEASGNFQANNYDRGGAGTDYVRAEAQDGSGDDNANFSTPAVDGVGVPRMQMFLWPGLQFGLPNAVTVTSGPAAGTYLGHFARFTPAPTPAGISGDIVLVNDGSGTPTDGCQPYSLPAGAIALVDRASACNFFVQATTAEAAGAGALVVANNAIAPVVMTGSMNPPVSIPATMISQADGTAIKAGLPATGRVHRNTDRPPMRDGDLENGIIIHEYGHGVSLRLTGGPTVNCLTGSEQAGEGWSDYFAIAMLLNPALDNPEGPRGMGTYASFQENRQGAGIRPRPYSRNMAIQPFTYDSIRSGGWLDWSSLAVPHGIGHGWAAVLWDMTWDLIDKYGFNPDVYGAWDTGGNNLALQLVIDGLKFQGCGPGFVVARDAIIAADEALTGGENKCTLWASFARRGLGFSAVQGTTSRNDNSEAFDTHPDCRAGFFGGVPQEPTLKDVRAGATQPLVFSLGGNHGLDIFASNSPYSRQVDCNTLETVDPASLFITPRPLPVKTQTPRDSGLSYDAAEDRYTYPWKTVDAWAGTCREVVVTRKDGVQHRAYFHFAAPRPSAPVSGHVRDADNEPLANATVTIEGASVSPATTDADGFYSFESVPVGTYSATASARGCNDPQTRELVVSKPATTLDFTLPRCTTQLVSVASDGAQGNGISGVPSVSADGRYVAFQSTASNLVPGDSNGASDVFVHDRDSGTTERVSVASDGAQGNGISALPSLSADGRYVAFPSTASNLVPGDSNGAADVFVHDRDSGTTERVSVASDGAQGNGISSQPSLSADGRHVAFQSLASNLVPGDNNGRPDIFVHDRDSGTTERVSVASDGAQGNGTSFEPSVSADGRYVAFYGFASNLVPGDSNGDLDVFVHDRDSGTTERVSVASDGAQGNGRSVTPAVSADGRYVAFASSASNLVPGDSNGNGTQDVFVHDRDSGTTERVSVASDEAQGNGFSELPAVSADGRFVAFQSTASNLVQGDSNGTRDVFLHDRDSATTERVSLASDGAQGNGASMTPSVSADGRYVAFWSSASNLIFRDSNGTEDVFVRDRSGPAAGALHVLEASRGRGNDRR